MSAIASTLNRRDVFAFGVKGGMLAGLSMRHVVLAVLFTAGYEVLGQLGFIDFSGSGDASRWRGFAIAPFHIAVAFIAVVAAIAVENHFTPGRWHFMRYPAAVLFAAVVGTWILEISSPPMVERAAKSPAILEQLGHVQLILLSGHFLKALYLCTLVVALHVVLEANYRAGSALQEARLKALDEERDVCEAGLRAMQARVDPDLLFESLRRVDAAYLIDPAMGQAKLEALIRFLRAALPGKNSGRSTVEHEKELAEAYVALVAAAGSTRCGLDFRATAAVLREAIPPMIVLPLIRWALADQPAADLTVAVNRRDMPTGSILELAVDNRRALTSEINGDEIEIVRERLACLYGKDIRFEFSAADCRRSALVELPVSAAPGPQPQEPVGAITEPQLPCKIAK